MMSIFKKPRLTAHQRGYNKDWRTERAMFLRVHRHCVHHLEMGAYVSATVVDHIVPHKGDMQLFWDRNNWQALCASCHNSKTATMDGGGYNKDVRTNAVMKGVKENGEPADPNHHWNRD